MATEPNSRAFDDVSSREALRSLPSSGAPDQNALPPIVAMGGSASAEWVEFAPERPSQGVPPLLWISLSNFLKINLVAVAAGADCDKRSVTATLDPPMGTPIIN